MDISELAPKELQFWNQMRDSHQSGDFAQLRSQLMQDKALWDFCNSALIQCTKEGDPEAVQAVRIKR